MMHSTSLHCAVLTTSPTTLTLLSPLYSSLGPLFSLNQPMTNSVFSTSSHSTAENKVEMKLCPGSWHDNRTQYEQCMYDVH